MDMKGGATITTNLELIRKKRGLTQMELAGRLNIRQSTISNIETGIRTPSLRLLCKMAEALGVTVDELINGKKED